MNRILFSFLYSLPVILLVIFCYKASKDKKDIINEKAPVFIVTGVVLFIFVFSSCAADIESFQNFNVETILSNIENNLLFIKYGFLKFSYTDIIRVCFLDVVILFGRTRFSKNITGVAIEIAISILLTILGINPFYICLAQFIKFTFTYGNNLKIENNILYILFFLYSIIIIPNSYIFSLVLFISLFENCKKVEDKKIFIYDRAKWVNIEKNMKNLTTVKYLFIYFKDKLSKREVKEFLLFLDNISYNNNVIRIHDDLYAVAFSEIDKSFGYSDDVVNKTIKSEIQMVEEMVKKRLYFPLIEEENNSYTYVTFKSDDFYYYKKFREKNKDKEKLFSAKSILMNRLNK